MAPNQWHCISLSLTYEPSLSNGLLLLTSMSARQHVRQTPRRKAFCRARYTDLGDGQIEF